MSFEFIRQTIADSMGAAINVRGRSPGLFQIELPAFLADGDVVPIYVKPVHGDALIITDLGETRARLRDRDRSGKSTDEMLARLAEPHGFALVEGEIRIEVVQDEVFAAILALLQIEAQAEGLADG